MVRYTVAELDEVKADIDAQRPRSLTKEDDTGRSSCDELDFDEADFYVTLTVPIVKASFRYV